MSDHVKYENDLRSMRDVTFIYGTADHDEINGTYEPEVIFGYDGDDEIRAGGGSGDD